MSAERPHALLETKLTPPPTPAGVVARPRVVAAVDRLDVPFLQVVAGPGYGKSLAVREVVERWGAPCAWVSLDPIDDTTTGFWSYVIASFRRAVGVGAEAAEMLGEGAAPESWLTALLRELEEADAPVVLVLDDLHVIRSRPVLDGLAVFVERIPPHVRVVVTSRVDPALPYVRWHLAGRAGEIRQDVLRFDADEVVALAAAAEDLDLGSDAVAMLVDRTEGWVAAIRLSLLSLRGRDVAAEALRTALPADRMVADYLVREVLDRLPADDRDLLLDLSVLDDFDGPLAHRVSGRADAGDRLRALEADGVLLVPVDEARTRLRFHALLADLLREELRWRHPERVAELHRRGAEHLAQHGHPRQALQHLVAGGMAEDAFALVAEASMAALDSGDFDATRSWVLQIPVALVGDDPGRMVAYTTLVQAAGETDAALGWVDRIDRSRADLTARQAAELDALHLFGALWQGDFGRAARAGGAFVAQHRRAQYTPPLLDRVPGALVRLGVHSGDLAMAERWREVMTTVDRTGMMGLVPVVLDAEVALMCGELDDADVLATDALAQVEQGGYTFTISGGEARTVAASVAFERGDLAEADRHSRIAADVLTNLRVTYLEVRARALNARVAAARFGATAGLDVLRTSRASLGHRHLGPATAALLDVTEAELRAQDGEPEAALAVLADLSPSPAVSLARARALADLGRTDEAVQAVGGWDRWLVPARIEALLLLALCRRGPDAWTHLQEAASLGLPRGYVRPYRSAGAPLVRLIRSAHRSAPTPELAALVELVAAPGTGAAPAGDFASALTEREQELLRLLPTHLTYREIADQLCVSINTVKTYQKALYRKLQVATRSDAVAAGRRAGLTVG